MRLEIRKLFLLLSVFFTLGSCFVPAFVLAKPITPLDLPNEFELSRLEARKLNQLAFTDARQIIGLAVKGLMVFMGAILFALLVYAGFLWMVAQGNAEKIEQAKNIIVWAVLGAAVMLVSYIVVNYIFVLFQPTDPNAVTQRAENTEAVKTIQDAAVKTTPTGCCIGEAIAIPQARIPAENSHVHACVEKITEAECQPDNTKVFWSEGVCPTTNISSGSAIVCNFNGGASFDVGTCAELGGVCFASSDGCNGKEFLVGSCGPGQICCKR